MKARKTALIVMMVIASTLPVQSQWTANWIWQSVDGPEDTWMCFRKQFTLGNVPQKAVAKIAVDSKYWLWVNGQLVRPDGGLARSPERAASTFYDTLDLGGKVKAGINTVAVLVVYYGKTGTQYISSGKGGLLFQADFDGTPLISDRTWKLRVHPAYGKGAASPVGRYSQHDEVFDARFDIPTWFTEGFDDSSWPTAVEKGIGPALPWSKLVQRPTPFFKYFGLSSYVNQAQMPTQGTGADIAMTIPYNCHVTGYLKVNSATGGETITIKTNHYDVEGKTILAKYITKSGTQEFENHQWQNGEIMYYTVPQGVQILDLKYRESGYDCSLLHSFSCSDPWYDTLWKKSQRTLYVCMRDVYMDCPDRERNGWTGNTCIDLPIALFALDRAADRLAVKSIRDVVNWRKADGRLAASVPGDCCGELPGQGLMVCSEYGFPWTYYWQSGDTGEFNLCYQPFKNYLGMWTFGSNGLLNHRSGDWDWWDWTWNVRDVSGGDIPVLENAIFYSAQNCMKKIAVVTGNAADTAIYNANMAKIKANFNNQFYKPDGYRSGTDLDDRANACAVLMGLADKSKWPVIKNVLMTANKASVYMDRFVSEALFTMGYTNEALNHMHSRYDYDVRKDCSTLWTSTDGTSHNHSWSGSPLYMMGAFMAGIMPTSPGFSNYRVFPCLGQIDSLSQSVETVRGQISVVHRNIYSSYSLSLVSPASTVATIGIPQRDSATILSITANGTVVYSNGAYAGSATGVTSAGENSRYVTFAVVPGTWTFVATYNKGLPPKNLALGTTVTGCTSLENADWGVAKLTDGATTSLAGAKGYTSDPYRASAASNECVEIDLGQNKSFTRVILYPRTDVLTTGGLTPNFPVNFTIQAKANGSSTYTTVATIVNQANPAGSPITYDFSSANARYVRIAVTQLGLPPADEATGYRFQLAEMEVYNMAVVASKSGAAPAVHSDVLRLSAEHGRIGMRISCNQEYSLKIFDVRGKTYARYQGKKNGKGPLYSGKLAQGLYFVQLKYAGKSVIGKAMVY